MITVVNLSTAVDKAYIIKNINIGTVHRVTAEATTPGGKGLNVAKSIRLLGEDVVVTGFNGDRTSAYIEEEMKRRGVACDFVNVPGEARYNIHIMDNQAGKSTSFLEQGFKVSDADVKKFLSKFTKLCDQSEMIVISGSAPEGCDDDIYTKIISITNEKGKRVLLDTSGDLLKNGIGAKPFMVKPNVEEMRRLLGRPISGKWQLVEGATNVFDMGIPLVVVSTGAEAAVAVSWDGVLSCKPPAVKAVNDVGCGDAMMAGFAVGLSKGYPLEDIFSMAVAAATANVVTLEPGMFRMEDYEMFRSKMKVTRIM